MTFNLICSVVVDYWTDRKLTCNCDRFSSILFNSEDFLLFFVVLNWIFLGFRLKIFEDITVDSGNSDCWLDYSVFFLSVVLKETDTQIQEIHLPT